MKANINQDRCKGCGLCMENCKKDAIRLTEQINKNGYRFIEVDQDKCIGCGVCYLVCPDGVFTIE